MRSPNYLQQFLKIRLFWKASELKSLKAPRALIFLFCSNFLITNFCAATQLDTAILSNSSILVQADNYGTLGCIGPISGEIVNKKSNNCNEISNFEFIGAAPTKTKTKFSGHLKDKLTLKLWAAGREAEIKLSMSQSKPKFKVKYSSSHQNPSKLKGFKFDLVNLSNKETVEIWKRDRALFVKRDCAVYKFDVGVDFTFLTSQANHHQTEKHSDGRPIKLGVVKNRPVHTQKIEVLFQELHSPQITVTRGGCTNTSINVADNLRAFFPTGNDFQISTNAIDTSTVFSSNGTPNLDSWIKNLSDHLRNHQNQNNGAITLGLPNHNQSTYWTSFPKEMAGYINALLNLGHLTEARAAIIFIMSHQDEDGGFQTRHYVDGSVYEGRNVWPGESDLSSLYLPIIVMNYFLVSGDIEFLRASRPYLEKSYRYTKKNLTEVFKELKIGSKVRANDNEINSALLSSVSEQWIYSFHAWMLSIQAMEAYASTHKILGTRDYIGLKAHEKELRRNLDFLLNKESGVFTTRTIREAWHHIPGKTNKPLFKLVGNKSDEKKQLRLLGPAQYYTQYGPQGALQFGRLSLNLLRDNKATKIQAGFKSTDGKNGIFVQAEAACKLVILSQGNIRRVPITGDCSEKLEIDLEWQTDKILVKLGDYEKQSLPIKNATITPMPAFVNVHRGELIVQSIGYESFPEHSRPAFGHASFDAEALNMGLHLPEYSDQLAATFLSAHSMLKTAKGGIAMSSGGFAPKCSAQHSGTLAGGLISSGQLDEGLEILSSLYLSRTAFNALPEYDCPAGVSNISKSSNASWTMSNTINGYVMSFGLRRSTSGIFLDFKRDFSVKNFKYLGRNYEISAKTTLKECLQITIDNSSYQHCGQHSNIPIYRPES